jgi:hypothetical protein
MAALRLGWKYPTYAAHESGLRVFPPKVASKYARAFDVHADFLLFGTRPPDWYDLPAGQQMTEANIPIRYMTLFSDESADEIERMNNSEVVRRDYCLRDDPGLPLHCFAMEVVSDEMGDLIPQKSILIVERGPTKIPPGSIVVLAVKRQVPPSIRKVKSMPGGRVRYVAANEDYEALEDNDARVIGRALLHVRHL